MFLTMINLFFRSPIVARIDNDVVKLLPPCLCFAECQIVYIEKVCSKSNPLYSEPVA